MESAQARVQNAATSMYEELDRTVLRKMQGDMFKCGAKCCENTSGSVEEVQRCIERCAEPLTKCQTYIQNEMQQFQDRLQRGALDCQDKAKDQMGPSSTDADISKAKAGMEKCVVDCADNHIKMLPNMLKKMKDSITKGVYS
ncbi:protein FAM136A-like [Mytilus californianus]|uniref:protein FAM136A-like n=1 Tax=Mytilus californianus TaxID=6549 RepID=UPI0022484F28|nr:protein FAM136A-like [Mytilus californianus]